VRDDNHDLSTGPSHTPLMHPLRLLAFGSLFQEKKSNINFYTKKASIFYLVAQWSSARARTQEVPGLTSLFFSFCLGGELVGASIIALFCLLRASCYGVYDRTADAHQ